MEFKSQICTSRSQSEKLLALGLKKETADMMYITDKNVPDEYRLYRLIPEYYEQIPEYLTHIPAWSLHRLLCLYGLDYTIKEVYNNAEECYGMLICAIEIAIEDEYFNKDYLEERK